ncbi:hypothetical protein CAPTEDRAFT_220075 [Capitella teleta]|uniref:Phosphatidylinositol-3-phosphatase SAC1 n=1 Tax=Capitella teleta TaxID=283909 RepID=R7T3T3_CAPTE|nr:hypothetical protein CAPTEDRAFT_220075 [Capitella teleta]|eukprot:ELT87336.1 hypothetical protein CAPTEDRAFT_220075 [Capitella teleta]
MAVHESMKLHVTPDKFYIVATDTVENEVLVIDRISQDISLHRNEDIVPRNVEVKNIYGLFGIIHLLAGPYLLVITKRVKVGEISGQSIYKVTGTEMLCYKRTQFHLNEKQVQDNTRYVAMVEHVLAMDSFYFCTTYDITHTMQRLYNTSPDFVRMPLHERADVRFVWNNSMIREFAQQEELSQYCLPVMLGFVEVRSCIAKGHAFQYIVISRRCSFRAGTRYYMRGVDSEGHAANFVETEQIVEYGSTRSSFVQTRGSVPLYWYQYPNLKYKPAPIISTLQNQNDAFQRHFAAQIYNYGKQVLINLLDQKGHEQNLVNNYSAQVQAAQNSNIRYVPFDFHKECKKMRWDRLSLLLDQISEDQASFGYFLINGGQVEATQDGVFRTNCIDCLDRTNVVQSLLARRSLQAQLQMFGILSAQERVEDQVMLETAFKNVWADNADACSKQYAGTGALKTDFTRTGRRTKIGLVRDGVNSLVRYVLNNFYDGFRQDSIDLFLGNYVVEEAEDVSKPCPLRDEKDWKYYALPVIFLVAFSMCVISILIPDEHVSEQVMYILFWGGSSAVTMAMMYFYGREFVDRPKLAQKLKIE